MKESTFVRSHSEMCCVPVIQSKRYLGFLTFSIIPKYCLFTVILGIAKMWVVHYLKMMSLRQWEMLWGDKTVDKRIEAVCLGQDTYFGFLPY